jgi:hypothetical protein
MATVDVNKLAAVLRVTPQRVQQLVGMGMPKEARGSYDLGRCLIWHHHHLQNFARNRQGESVKSRAHVAGDAIVAEAGEAFQAGDIDRLKLLVGRMQGLALSQGIDLEAD